MTPARPASYHLTTLSGRHRRRRIYFWVTLLAAAFLAGAFLAAAFLAGAFLAAFLTGWAVFSAFFGSSTPTSLAARSPTARVCEATLPSASWVSSTAWSV